MAPERPPRHAARDSEETMNESDADSATGPVSSSRTLRNAVPWIVVTLVILSVAAIRVRLLDIPLERDEGEYAYAGQLILQGVPPYVLVYNMKFPGTYAAYALCMAIFGQTAAGIRLGLIALNAFTIGLIFLLSRRLVNPLAGVIGAAAYAVLSLSPAVMGLAAHATHFVVAAAMAGFLVLLWGIDRDQPVRILEGGFCLGVAILMKQPGAVFAAAAGAYLVWTSLRIRPLRWRKTILKLGLLVLGAVLPFLMTALALWWGGLFGNFWLWTFEYAAQYVSYRSPGEGLRVLGQVLPSRVGASGGIWLLAGLGLIGLWVQALAERRRTSDHRALDAAVFLSLLAAASFVGASIGFYWRPHYFILMLPAVAMLTGAGVGLAWEHLERRSSSLSHTLTFLPVVFFAGAVAYAVWVQRDVFFRMTPAQVCRVTYGSSPFPEAERVAQYIRDHTLPEDRITVVGSEPEIYFYANRRSSTGFIYMYPLMEAQKFASMMQRRMIREIEQHPPAYIVFVSAPTSWNARPESDDTILQWLNQFARDHCEEVALAEMSLNTPTTYAWYSPPLPKRRSINSIIVLRVLRRSNHP